MARRNALAKTQDPTRAHVARVKLGAQEQERYEIDDHIADDIAAPAELIEATRDDIIPLTCAVMPDIAALIVAPI